MRFARHDHRSVGRSKDRQLIVVDRDGVCPRNLGRVRCDVHTRKRVDDLRVDGCGAVQDDREVAARGCVLRIAVCVLGKDVELGQAAGGRLGEVGAEGARVRRACGEWPQPWGGHHQSAADGAGR